MEETMAKQSHTKRAIAGIVLACAIMSGAIMSGAILSAPAQALDPGDAIQTRKAVMASIGAHMNGIKAGMAAKNGKLVAGHAGAIAALAPILPGLFPKGSGPESGETRAKAEIWQQWDRFVATTKALRKEAEELALVTELGDMAEIAAQFGTMARAGCGACHRPFRAPK
ncbi:MAG: cytochrome c [Rhodospirillaceae bacterium]|nr:cytochrome c [Rhodospirillaceae bacterium]